MNLLLAGSLLHHSASSAAPQPACLAKSPAQLVEAERIVDGDTLVLNDKRRVRLIGVDTPELKASHPIDRHWAQVAKQSLIDTLAPQATHDPFVMIPGKTAKDRYGRTLAHLLLPDGTLLSEKLIASGLGLAVTVGNNSRCSATLFAAEKRARAQARGIWQTPGAWLSDEQPLRGDETGFHLVRARVASVNQQGRKTTLTLDNGLTIKIRSRRAMLKQLNVTVLEQLVNQPVEVRGWLRSKAGKVTLSLQHASNISLGEH